MFESLGTGFRDFVKYISGKSVINEKNIEVAIDTIKNTLIEADVNLRVVRRFVNSVVEEARGIKVLRNVDPKSQFIKIVNDRLVNFLGDKHSELILNPVNKLSCILMLGLQGAGKTTTCAKLAMRLKSENRRVLLVAADTFRAAAVEQLRFLGVQMGVSVFTLDGENNPIEVVKKSIEYAKVELFDTVIVDTRGRLEVEDLLLKEIRKIKAVLTPTETILVADAMTGQIAVNVAKEFNDSVGITGVIFTKFDSDARGGAILSLKTICGAPIKFVGVGERPEDLDVFYPDRVASRILGMGDVVSLVEKAQTIVDKEEALKLEEKLRKANFNFEDYLNQFKYMRSMGGISSLMGMLPGVSSSKMLFRSINEKQIKKEEAIILSMTKQERLNPVILNNSSRKKRIALGSGTSIFEVNKLIKKFSQVVLMMKKMQNKSFQNKIASLLGGKGGIVD
ncbi:signal recognition particle protein [Borrelia miyamotoi]|uniref:Signal recognition particle protein n=1 Tax=Borrelia miyamotoi TaxID=47466 RepID=A0AAX3JKX1_9SPIR|nr:signal recognition particle protein [Borrelia miyamotoi]QFP41681.1 signal recognition particle protein [Borrelia miyamotoi]QFP47801.1 signal recognition particle protein [Borrelia miyamotoi]QGT55560.1 signal recognition particle protein [Borrelia miyamotoi]QGT56344.1 signal recognition particle protein [Borrelia miyamotoi]WAZ71591.1 signal recognition particle protein [Borrelia miyamotoi]